MNDNVIPIIGAKKKEDISLELPATFSTTLYFINHNGEMTKMEFALPPGVYPNPRWLEKLIQQATRGALKTLKMSTKDLSWRVPSTFEFFRVTAGPQAANYNVLPKWQAAYSNPMDINVPEVEAPESDDNSN